MDYRIIEKEAFTLVGKELRTRNTDGQNLKEIPAFWETSMQDGTTEKLMALAPDTPMYGVCTNFSEDMTEFTYVIAVEAPADKADAANGFVAHEIPALTWAVFVSSMEDIHATWGRIFQEWFPATGYEHDMGPELEVYVWDGDKMVCEIWIPIVKK